MKLPPATAMKTNLVKYNQNSLKYMAELTRKKGNPQGPEAKKKLTTSREYVKADASIALEGVLGFSNPGAWVFTHKGGSEKEALNPCVEDT